MKCGIDSTPWSRSGSWISIVEPQRKGNQPLGPGIYLRSHHSRGVARQEVFLLEALDGAKTVPVDADARPAILILRHRSDGRRRIEFVLENDTTVRIRGVGLGLRMRVPVAPGVVAHEAGTDLWTVNVRSALRRYQVQRIRGDVSLDADWRPNNCDRIAINCLPDESGTWEVAMDEFWSTWVPQRRTDFDGAHRRVADEFAAFSARFPAPAPRHARTALAAVHLLWSCTVSPCGNLKRPAVFMSKQWMDQVWSWDNCFNMAALAPAHPELAMDQYRLMADWQDEFGAFPDAVNDGFMHYNFSKPPVQGLTFNWIARSVPRFWTRRRMEEFYTPTARFTNWWLDHRRLPGMPLCHYLHGNDSGWDNSTMFDEGVPLIAPDLNSFLVVQARVLSRVAARLGKRKEAVRWAAVADQLRGDLLDALWQGDRFVAIRAGDGHVVDCRSLIPCMPIVLGTELPRKVRAALVARLERLVTGYGLATEEPDSPHYEADGYWRGPVWGPSTMIAVQGLLACGERRLAARIADNYCKACRKSGFAENFDALTGASLRDPAYTWTASAFLCLSEVS